MGTLDVPIAVASELPSAGVSKLKYFVQSVPVCVMLMTVLPPEVSWMPAKDEVLAAEVTSTKTQNIHTHTHNARTAVIAPRLELESKLSDLRLH